jgi:hypothetical protein
VTHNNVVRIELNSANPPELADTLAAIRVAHDSARREELQVLQREVERLRAEFENYITRFRR